MNATTTDGSIKVVVYGRDEEVLRTARRKARQGLSVDVQYKALNRARDKRARRKEKTVKQMLAGGFNIAIVGL